MFFYKEIIKKSKTCVVLKLVSNAEQCVKWIDLLAYTLYMPDVVYTEYKDDSDDVYSKIYKSQLRSKKMLKLSSFSNSKSTHLYKHINIEAVDDFPIYGMLKPY